MTDCAWNVLLDAESKGSLEITVIDEIRFAVLFNLLKWQFRVFHLDFISTD